MTEERCDNKLCDSKVLVTFGKVIGDKDVQLLGFCGHHGNRHYVTLTRKGWVILDDQRQFRIEDPKGSKSTKRSTRRQASTPEGSESVRGGPDDPEDEVPVS